MALRRQPYFLPTQITGCSLWLDGADSSSASMTFSSGTNISVWKDKSGSANNATAVGVPTYGANSVVMGGSAYFTLPGISANSSNEAFFMVVNWSSAGAEQPFFIGTTLNGGRCLFISPGSPTLVGSSYNVANTSIGTNGGTPANTIIMVELMTSSLVNTVYTNGQNAGPPVAASYSGGGTSVLGVGFNEGAPRATQYLTGNIYEVVMYNTSITNTQRQQVEGYLAQKWGLTASLPANHPGLTSVLYRVQRPFFTKTPYFTRFSPLQISGLVLWLDGADPAGTGVPPASGTLTTWTDKSTAGNNATGGVSPTYSSTTRAVSFNGSSTYLQTSLSAVPSNETFFAVFTSTIPISNANRFNCIIGASGNNGRDINVLTSSAGNSSAYDLRYDSWAVGSISLTGYGGITFNTLTLATTQFTGGQGAGSTYGSNFGSFQSLSFSSSSTTRIGAGNGGDYYTGTINEIIMYNTVLGLSDRQKLESYLAQKWGLTSSLPAAHLNATFPAGSPTAIQPFISRIRPALSSIPFVGGGGTSSSSGNFSIRTFTTTSQLILSKAISATILVVGGGGGGGSAGVQTGGGGAGGAVFVSSPVTITAGTYTVTVGTGGGINTNGTNSTFLSYTGIGGGGGGNWINGAGKTGGCGGGGSGEGGAGAAGSQGFGGANGRGQFTCGGGGGGMGQAGKQPADGSPSSGGNGLQYSITGSAVYYAGGGAGGFNSPSTGGLGGGGDKTVQGTDGLGGGGGSGARGGNGVVIISFVFI